MERSKVNRRQFLQWSAGLAAGAALAACTPAAAPAPAAGEAPKSGEAAKEAAPQAEGGATKLSIMWRTNPDENPMVDELIVKFKEKQPNVTMESIVVPWNEYEPKLMSMYAGGIAPDIYGTGGTNPYVERSFRNMVLVLDPFVEKDKEMVKDLWPVGLKSYTIGGKLIAMTFALLDAGVFINATRFDEAGVAYPPVDWNDKSWNWEAMLDLAKKLTKDTNGDGKVEQYGINLGHWSPWYYTRMWGQDLVSKEDYASGIFRKWQTDVPAVYDACVSGLQARADAIYQHKVTPTPASAQSLGQMGPMLKTGVVAMEFTGGWAIWGELPEKFKFRAAPNPLGGVNGSGTRCKNTWAEPLQICSQTKGADQAWEFVKFMTVDPDAIAIEMAHRSMIPAARSAFDGYIAEYSKRLAMTEEEQKTFFLGALEQAETTVPDHILVGSAAVRDIEISELDPVWNGEKTAKEAVDTMIPLINAKLQENLKQLNIS